MIALDNKDLITSLMDKAIDLSIDHVHGGGIPFSALVVDNEGNILGAGVNRVDETCDPTAHAEVVAIRNACQYLNDYKLKGATLIASGEPCAMCYMSALWSGIDQVIYAVDRETAASFGIDYRWGYQLLALDMPEWPIDILTCKTERSFQPFDIWAEKHC